MNNIYIKEKMLSQNKMRKRNNELQYEYENH